MIDDQNLRQVPTVAGDYPLTGDVAEAMSRYGSDDHYDVLGQLLGGIDINR